LASLHKPCISVTTAAQQEEATSNCTLAVFHVPDNLRLGGSIVLQLQHAQLYCNANSALAHKNASRSFRIAAAAVLSHSVIILF